MARTAPFEAHSGRYDKWFMRHEAVYLSELLAVRALLPWKGMGLEVGVGTGRFAAPLGVQFGIDPAPAMLSRARQRGVACVGGTAEALPFADRAFDYALMVIVLSFLDDPGTALLEIRRILQPGGVVVIGFLDHGCPCGRDYLARHREKLFFRAATFFDVAGVQRLLADAGFRDPCWAQTLFYRPEELTELEPMGPGHGDGAFVVVRAVSR